MQRRRLFMLYQQRRMHERRCNIPFANRVQTWLSADIFMVYEVNGGASHFQFRLYNLYFKIRILTVTGCCGWLYLDIYLPNLKGLLSNMSQQPCGHKMAFWESFFFSLLFFFLYDLDLILTESNIQWWPFISIGSSSFSSITCAARAISC